MKAIEKKSLTGKPLTADLVRDFLIRIIIFLLLYDLLDQLSEASSSFTLNT